jgi:hypothetical protein
LLSHYQELLSRAIWNLPQLYAIYSTPCVPESWGKLEAGGYPQQEESCTSFLGGLLELGDARKPPAKGQSPSALPLRYLESYITEWLNIKIFKFNLLKSPSLGKF